MQAKKEIGQDFQKVQNEQSLSTVIFSCTSNELTLQCPCNDCHMLISNKLYACIWPFWCPNDKSSKTLCHFGIFVLTERVGKKVSKRSGCEHKEHAFDIACECVHRFWVSSSKHFFSQYFAHISHNACLCHFFTWCAVIQRQFALDLRTKELLKGFFFVQETEVLY